MNELNEKWDLRFLSMATLVGSWSKDPSTKVGAVMVRPDRSVISVGYNGFAKGVQDLPERYENREKYKYLMVAHAEINCMTFADRASMRGCCLYLSPFMPCSRCAAVMIQCGVKRVVSFESDSERWAHDFNLTRIQFSEAEVEMVLYSQEEWRQMTGQL